MSNTPSSAPPPHPMFDELKQKFISSQTAKDAIRELEGSPELVAELRQDTEVMQMLYMTAIMHLFQNYTNDDNTDSAAVAEGLRRIFGMSYIDMINIMCSGNEPLGEFYIKRVWGKTMAAALMNGKDELQALQQAWAMHHTSFSPRDR